MDGALVLQYRVLLVLVAAGLAFGMLVTLAHANSSSGRAEPGAGDSPAPLAGTPAGFSAVMLLLTALAVGAGILVALPALIILPFFDSWRVLVLALAAVLLLAAPLLYAWRTRPF